MEIFETLLAFVGYGLGAVVAMAIVHSGLKARRTRVNLQHIRDFMNRRDLSRGKF